MDKRQKWIITTIVSDILLFNFSIVFAFLVRFGYPIPYFNFKPYLDIAFFITITQVLLFYTSGLYKPFKKSTFYPVFFEIVKDITINTLLITTISYFGYKFSFPRRVILLAWGFSIILIPFGRILINTYFKRFFSKRALVIGGEGERICKELLKYTSFENCYKLSDHHNLLTFIEKNDITDVIVVRKDNIFELLSFLEGRGINIHILPDLYELRVGKSPLIELGGVPLLEIKEFPIDTWEWVLKRGIDLFFSLIGLFMFSPLFIIIPILIKLDDRGRIFYAQERIGYRGERFIIYKFRTMIEGAEEGDTPVLASENDPRITRVGKFLRRWRIDEIPQLFNVLKGDMSLVGPRPERPKIAKELEKNMPLFRERLKVKPGITGLAQVFGRYDSSPQDKLRYDIAYIYNYTLFLDFKIMFFTLRVFFTGWGSR